MRNVQPIGDLIGRGFAKLSAAVTLGPIVDMALTECPTRRADGPLQKALLHLGERHNALSISKNVIPVIDDYAVNINDAIRPYPVLNTRSFIGTTVAAITDARLRNLPRVGTIDQLTHSDDTLVNCSTWPQSIADTYRTMLHNADHATG